MYKHLHSKSNFPIYAIILIIACTSSCSNRRDTSSGITVVKEILLPEVLRETSGLYCSNNNIYTINDSGNEPVIYALDNNGNLNSEINIDAKNVDWEAISSDGEKFYIGDFGNNGGNRTDLNVLIYDTSDKQTQQLSFTYANEVSSGQSGGDNISAENKSKDNRYKAHDVDAEAIVLKDNTLILFSKSWKTGVAKVYQMKTDDVNQILSPVTSIAGLPGIITGADWDEHKRRFVIVGYQVFTFSVQPFIAILDAQYNITKIDYLKGFSQVEGVCAVNGEFWFTQEKLPFHPAKLVNIRL